MTEIMAKRTTTTSGAVKRTRKTAPRKTARRTAAKPVGAEATQTAVAAPGVARSPEPTTEQIAERAYFLSLERKGPGGPLDDWLRAERELRNGSIPV